jgi:ABC-type uncharacterized transport system ATPase subunit
MCRVFWQAQLLHHLVSLAITLLHKPPLLILDEPTVGVDPVLRAKLWQHLKSLVETEGVTILITTHYIEEARYHNYIHMHCNMLRTISSLHMMMYVTCMATMWICFRYDYFVKIAQR